MTDWNCQVVKLDKIERHPNAETLEMSKVLGGYTVIFKEGRFKQGDLAAYVAADTICSDHPEFEWLGDKKLIRPVRLRGIFSLGILAAAPEGMQEGDSIVDYYKLQKYEPEEEKASRDGTDRDDAPKGWSLPYYDLSSLRKYPNLLDNEEVVLNEKIEGENYSAIHDGTRLWVKSHRMWKKDVEGSHWWEIAHRLELEKKLAPFPMMAFVGELYGGVKGFMYDATATKGKLLRKLRIFDVYDVKRMAFLDYDDMIAIAKTAGLETTPELYRGKWNPELVSLAEGKSTIGECVREGFVGRTTKEQYDLIAGRRVCKWRGEGYLLKKK